MADYGFNGTTLTFGVGSAMAKVKDIQVTENGNEVDVTGSDDDLHNYVLGIPDVEISVTVVGTTSVALGDTGAMSIAFNDGTTETFDSATFIVTSKPRGGSMDGEITSTITFKPYVALT